MHAGGVSWVPTSPTPSKGEGRSSCLERLDDGVFSDAGSAFDVLVGSTSVVEVMFDVRPISHVGGLSDVGAGGSSLLVPSLGVSLARSVSINFASLKDLEGIKNAAVGGEIVSDLESDAGILIKDTRTMTTQHHAEKLDD